ncbi:winged helix-turn-helix domain-containing protein [Patescibacteria group bacterium]|nr:winged helix-turn-helix domain-containing protein [Patescibacteria group bacterium]
MSNKSLIDESSVHFEYLYPPETRFEEIEKIAGYIKEGKSCQLISLPGVGRSNLFGLLSFNKHVRAKHFGENAKWFHFVYMDFSEITNRSLEDVNKYIFLSLTDSLRDRKLGEEYIKVQQIFKKHLEYGDEMVLFQGLKEAIDYLALEKELTLVFLFDKFAEYIPNINSQFFTNLKIFRNRAKYRFSVVFSLNRSLDELIEPIVFKDFYEFVADNLVFLPLFDKPGIEFRLSYLEKITGKRISDKKLDLILSLTGGHGKLTRVAMETVLTTEGENKEDLSSFLLTQKTIQGCLREIWSSFNPSEQEEIKNNKKFSDYLQKINLVKNNKVAIPLLINYAKEIVAKEPQKIIFDENKKEILIGSTNLSERLTDLEYKLLRFFIENKEKILTRDEIINYVWQTKTTEGVSDQALDQLISRIRKKIEATPNDPIHLQTIKGRGFKFNP